MRRAVVDRRTRETQIRVRLGIEGKGRYDIRTGIRFLDHMLELATRHGAFDLEIRATGDLDVDQHHTVEDLGIALGRSQDCSLILFRSPAPASAWHHRLSAKEKFKSLNLPSAFGRYPPPTCERLLTRVTMIERSK